jgi:hypothetical protein
MNWQKIKIKHLQYLLTKEREARKKEQAYITINNYPVTIVTVAPNV